MPYQPNIPTGTVELDQDYLNLRGNFQQLDVSFGIDHVPFSINTALQPAGYHESVHLNPISTTATRPPDNFPLNPADYTVTPGFQQLFSAQINDSFSTDTALFSLTGGGILSQLTSNILPVASANGCTFLPGGLILNYGKVAISANPTLTTVTFKQAYTSTANVFSVILTRITADNSTTANEVRISSGSISATMFKISSSSSSSANNVYWIAIGK